MEAAVDELGERMQEADWLAGIASGDEASFRAFYQRFSTPLFSLLIRMLRNQHDAEEVLQTVFLHVWRRPETYNPELSSVFTWLTMITRSRGIDRMRSRQRQTAAVDRLAMEESPNAGGGVTEPHGDRERRDLVASALREIPEEQRAAIELAFFSGLSQAEISAQLAEPLGTVKARIRRGMLRLRDYFHRRL